LGVGCFQTPLTKKHPKTQQATKQQEQGTMNIRANLKIKCPFHARQGAAQNKIGDAPVVGRSVRSQKSDSVRYLLIFFLVAFSNSPRREALQNVIKTTKKESIKKKPFVDFVVKTFSTWSFYKNILAIFF
jgi:hypothetical protein